MYDKYPEFISTDPRTQRKSNRSYTITQEFTEGRHKAFFESIDLKDKTVLDLGCCVASLGAWVLDKGAKHYHGVEYDETLCNLANKNLSKYFNNFTITQDFIENFFENNTEHFDIIVASGIIYGYFNPSEFIDEVVQISNNIILESRHPLYRWLKETKFDAEGYFPINHIKSLEKLPIVVYYPGNASMMLSDKASNLKFNGSCPTKGFVDHYFKLKGFVNNQTLDTNIQKYCPDVYNSNKRYASLYIRSDNDTGVGFKDAFNNNDYTVTGFYNE